ncbi:MAG: putative hydrolase YxeP [Planctomycetota bacterium]|jgi:amidohydrolase
MPRNVSRITPGKFFTHATHATLSPHTTLSTASMQARPCVRVAIMDGGNRVAAVRLAWGIAALAVAVAGLASLWALVASPLVGASEVAQAVTQAATQAEGKQAIDKPAVPGAAGAARGTVAAGAAGAATDRDLREWTRGQLESLVAVYRDFHANPELSLQEKTTAERLAKLWRESGLEVTTGVGGHGVVGLLRNGSGPTVMFRTDLDALPVVERTELAYASKVKVKDAAGAEVGVMHACGHDIHITSLVGVARYLAARKDRWKGTAMFIGQPAEERVLGAQAMLADGLFTRFPKPDFAIAQHVDSALAAGHVGLRAGYSLANTDSVDIVVKGKGGHGAYPHTTVDPIVQAAELIMALQTIVSREVQPTEPAVITVGSIHGGTKHNIIGDTCHLQLTVRSYSDQVREQLLKAIERKAKAVAAGARAPEPTISVTDGTPALFNDGKLTARIEGVFRKTFGDDRVVPAEQSMGGEDFSRYGKAGVPILMFRLGAVEAKRLDRYKELGQDPPSLHSALFYPDAEPTLETGVVAMAAAALELLR